MARASRSQRNKEAVRTRGGALRSGRMPCPECGAQMELPLQAMYTGQPIPCLQCGSTLAVRVQDSQSALAALRKAEAMVESIHAINRRRG